MAFDLGAQAERIRAIGWGELLPIRTPAADLNDCLLALEPPEFPREGVGRDLDISYESYRADYYDGIDL